MGVVILLHRTSSIVRRMSSSSNSSSLRRKKSSVLCRKHSFFNCASSGTSACATGSPKPPASNRPYSGAPAKKSGAQAQTQQMQINQPTFAEELWTLRVHMADFLDQLLKEGAVHTTRHFLDFFIASIEPLKTGTLPSQLFSPRFDSSSDLLSVTPHTFTRHARHPLQRMLNICCCCEIWLARICLVKRLYKTK